jgi:hypothetical protein
MRLEWCPIKVHRIEGFLDACEEWIDGIIVEGLELAGAIADAGFPHRGNRSLATGESAASNWMDLEDVARDRDSGDRCW